MRYSLFILVFLMLLLSSCLSKQQKNDIRSFPITFMTLEPGHFHAALVYKESYPEVDTNIYVYAPEGKELISHLNLLDQYNKRSDNPTHWTINQYTESDYVNKLFEEKAGNVMVVAGNNRRKTEFIAEAIKNGVNVYSDKPMAITPEDYEVLMDALDLADEKGLLLYDIMTERFEITTILQKELAKFPEIFGELLPGTIDNPSVTKESVHHFYKEVSGSSLIRPAWFFDTEQEGAGIVDVSTHLVDLILWSFFENEEIQVSDAQVMKSRQWSTKLTQDQFTQVTLENNYPEYLEKDVKGGDLYVDCNGEFVFSVKDVVGKVSVIWNFEAPEGAKDTHYSIMKGEKSSLEIVQNEMTNYKPELFIRLPNKSHFSDIEVHLDSVEQVLNKSYPGVEFLKNDNGWKVHIPEQYHISHEAHFGQVTRKYIDFLKEGKIPQWEKDFLRVKYFLTTDAYARSLKNNFM